MNVIGSPLLGLVAPVRHHSSIPVRIGWWWRAEEGNSVVTSFGLHDGLRQSGRRLRRALRHG